MHMNSHNANERKRKKNPLHIHMLMMTEHSFLWLIFFFFVFCLSCMQEQAQTNERNEHEEWIYKKENTTTLNFIFWVNRFSFHFSQNIFPYFSLRCITTSLSLSLSLKAKASFQPELTYISCSASQRDIFYSDARSFFSVLIFFSFPLCALVNKFSKWIAWLKCCLLRRERAIITCSRIVF